MPAIGCHTGEHLHDNELNSHCDVQQKLKVSCHWLPLLLIIGWHLAG